MRILRDDTVTPRPAGPQEPDTPPQAVISRIDFIDGLRGLAALAVVILHAFEVYGIGWINPPGYEVYTAGALGAALEQLYGLVVLRFGWAVEVFIVISGYSLMLPVVRAGDGRMRGGTLRFFRRRARRILPPYYAAIVLSLLFIALVPGMGQPSAEQRYWNQALPAFDPGVLLSHLFLVHNLSGAWTSKIDPPMWSIAVEAQIYLLFPLLVLIARRSGAAVALAVTLVVGLVQGYGTTLGLPSFPFSYPWFVSLFGMGMFAAWLSFSPQARARRLRDRLPWLAVAAGSFALMLAVKASRVPGVADQTWVGAPIFGLVIAALLVHLGTRPDSPLCRLFQLPWVVRLGHCSYSLYLVHAPVLTAIGLAVLALGFSGPEARLVTILAGPPLALLVTYPFYLAFERPFSQAPRPRPAVRAQPA